MSERWQELLGLVDELTPPRGLADRAEIDTGPSIASRSRPRRARMFLVVMLVAVAALVAVLGVIVHTDQAGLGLAPRGSGGLRGGAHPGSGPLEPGLGDIPPEPPRPGAELLGVDASGPDDVWAAGQIRHSREFRAESLLEHWDGTSWRAVSCPDVGELRGVAVAARGDVWALGDHVLLHWHDGRCERIPAPSVGGEMGMASIAAAGPRSIWICGVRPGIHFPAGNFTGWNTLVARWNGSHWHVFDTPNRSRRDNDLHGIVAISPTDVWAAGYAQMAKDRDQTLVLHWNGSTWQLAQTPNPGGAFNVIWGMGFDPEHVWALGHYGNEGHNARLTGLLLRGSRGTWTATQPPSDHRSFTASALSGVSPNDVWAVGGWPNGGVTLIHFDGHQWTTNPATTTPLAKQSTLADVVAITATDAWAVGVTSGTKKLSERPLVEHWDGTSWHATILSADADAHR